MKRAIHMLLLSSLAACNVATRSAASGDKEDVNPADRKILGVPAPYAADASLRARQDELDASMAARRAVGWATLRKVLQPVSLADANVPSGATVPRFQTWYAKDDFVRMWKELYKELGSDGRKARAPLAGAAMDAIFDWNAHMVDMLPTWPADRYAEYVARLKTDEDWMAEGAGHRVSYSPAVMTHLFANYGRVLGCMNTIDATLPDAPPATPDNFTSCFDSEFPVGAAVVKAQWRRAELGMKLPTFDTSPDAIQQRWDAGADWGAALPSEGIDDPGADRIHTVRLANGNVYRLVGLHVITKELRKWLWVTMWWAPDGDGDFGADRPADLEADPIFRHYKMCVVTAHDERDPSEAPGPTWCTNPYLERGAGNARTNCIGCHQHGGTSLLPETIIGDESRFPSNGRTEVRANFPTDYSWALTREDNLARVIADEVAYYDSFEK